VTDFQNFFTGRLSRKFAAKLSLNFPKRLKGVSILPWKYYFWKSFTF